MWPLLQLRINVKLKSKNKIELAICIPWSWSWLWSVLWLQLPNPGAEATASGDGQILHENEQNKEGWRRLEPCCVFHVPSAGCSCVTHINSWTQDLTTDTSLITVQYNLWSWFKHLQCYYNHVFLVLLVVVS